MHEADTDLLGLLTLEEKTALCSGRDFWHLKGVARLDLPELTLTDGPHGLRKQEQGATVLRSVPATCFPTASTLANSWDRELLFAIGVALGEECRQENVAILLGPGANIKRSPLCGRNFEYFSEDPCLSGELAAAWIEGIQSQGVGASLKHFAVNNQEYRRMTIDARVDERTLREIYLAGFERAITKARPWTVMCAYNRLNGTYCSEHETLLRDILRKEWGYDGLVVSDWGACNDRVAGLQAGLDIEMPGSAGQNDARIAAAVRAGTLDVAVLDRAVARVLRLIRRCASPPGKRTPFSVEAHHALARHAAAQSLTLLKNDGAVLPLARSSLLVVGAFAETPRYQGAGSSQINPTRLDNALDAIRRYQPDCAYARGYDPASDQTDQALIEEARAGARRVDTVVVFAGLPAAYECEGFDRPHMDLPESHNRLIEALAETRARIVVVLCNGAPVAMPWVERVAAVLGAGLAGQAGGHAIADVLFGTVNPCGKLAETYPRELADTPARFYFPGGPDVVEYREALYVGYRYYDSFKRPVLFPFGHGLSYTRFEYSNLSLSKTRLSAGESVGVSVELCNVGSRQGAEIVQLYVRDQESTVFRPNKELREFCKVSLAPGERRRIEFTLEPRAFAWYDSRLDDWRVESGAFDIQIGASSVDIRAQAQLWIDAEPGAGADQVLRESAPVYFARGLKEGERTLRIDDRAFYALYGNPPVEVASETAYSLNSRLGEIRHHWLGALIYQAVLRTSRARLGADRDPTLSRMSEEMTDSMPLRLLVLFSDGHFTFNAAQWLLAALNGRFWRRLWRRCRGWFGAGA